MSDEIDELRIQRALRKQSDDRYAALVAAIEALADKWSMSEHRTWVSSLAPDLLALVAADHTPTKEES